METSAMTYEEAAVIIGNIPINEVDNCYTVCEYQEAKRLAIKALMEKNLKINTENAKSNEYCEPDCEYLSSRHNCQKYHKGLAYSKYSIGGASFGPTHERCSECEKDYIIAELEARNKPQKILYRKQSYGTPWLCQACEADQSEVQFVDTGEVTTGGKYSFCWACGQKLDWDVEEYKED